VSVHHPGRRPQRRSDELGSAAEVCPACRPATGPTSCGRQATVSRRQRAQHLDRVIDAVVVDVKVRDQAQEPGPSARNKHPCSRAAAATAPALGHVSTTMFRREQRRIGAQLARQPLA